MEDLMYLGEIVFRLFRLLGFFGLLGRVWTICTNDYSDPGVRCGKIEILK